MFLGSLVGLWLVIWCCVTGGRVGRHAGSDGSVECFADASLMPGPALLTRRRMDRGRWSGSVDDALPNLVTSKYISKVRHPTTVVLFFKNPHNDESSIVIKLLQGSQMEAEAGPRPAMRSGLPRMTLGRCRGTSQILESFSHPTWTFLTARRHNPINKIP